MPDLYPPRTIPTKTLARARSLRRDMTDAERKLWYKLKDRALVGHKFRRQCAIGNYIVDFCCIERRLIVELDGEQHYQKTKAYDDRRTNELGKRRFRVIRFWNQEVTSNLDGVLEEILRQLQGELLTRPHLPRFARPFSPVQITGEDLGTDPPKKSSPVKSTGEGG